MKEKLNGLDVLELDHLRVHKLFKQLQRTRPWTERVSLYHKIRAELLTHAQREENAFYPLVERIAGLRPVVLSAYEEHAVVKTLLRDIDQLLEGGAPRQVGSSEALSSSERATLNERFRAKMDVLIESVEHHVREEENLVFPRVRRLVKSDELVRLGDRMLAIQSSEKPPGVSPAA